jgi:hypothetical protein
MSVLAEARLSQAVDDAIQGIVSAEHYQAGSIVSLPVLYPSGSTVLLEVTKHGDRLLVSDRGGGMQEAELMGATRHYKDAAERIATEAGVRFDGLSMFVVEVSIDRLAGAMVVVANCSQDAAVFAAERVAESTEADAREILFARLSAVFRGWHVEKDARVIGASNHPWKVAVEVVNRHRRAIFEPVNRRYITIVGTAAKFHDLARLETPPARFAMVGSIQELGDYYGVVSDASDRVVESSVSDNTIRELLAA